jgi:hypothetical protein
MPYPRDSNAPYFSAKGGESMPNFLYEYECFATDNGLTSAEKVEAILRYVPPDLREFWETISGYETRDGDSCAALLLSYTPIPPPLLVVLRRGFTISSTLLRKLGFRTRRIIGLTIGIFSTSATRYLCIYGYPMRIKALSSSLAFTLRTAR